MRSENESPATCAVLLIFLVLAFVGGWPLVLGAAVIPAAAFATIRAVTWLLGVLP